MLVLKSVFHAHDRGGKTYDVHVYAESADGPGPHIETLKSVNLADGRELRVLSKGHYALADGSLELESHAHDAI